MSSQFAESAEGELLQRLNDSYRAALRSYFRRRVRCATEADDLTQEVFLRVIRQGNATGISNSDAYVFSVAANLLRDRVRKSVSRQIETSYAIHPFQESELEERTPDRVLMSQEKLLNVLTALDEMGERTRNIFLLHRLEHMKQRQIADLLGLSVSAVEKHVIKAVAHLARTFGHDAC